MTVPQRTVLERRVRVAAWATVALVGFQIAGLLAVSAGLSSLDIRLPVALAWIIVYSLLAHSIFRRQWIPLTIAAVYGVYRLLLLIAVLIGAVFGVVSQDWLLLLRGAVLGSIVPFCWIQGWSAASRLRRNSVGFVSTPLA
jgi:hypothetical protein